MLKITRILQLLLLLAIFRDVLASSTSCKVPVTENGQMGRVQSILKRWRFQKEFVAVLPGEEISSNETLLLRCIYGFKPAENSEFSENIELEVTCIDGEWSNSFGCYKTSCTGEPPVIANGTPVVSRREHGHQIWYRCDDKNVVKVRGFVKCHFGSWIGNPPKCFQYPCLTRSLIYPGLVIPQQEYLDSNESIEINCGPGFRRERGVNKITCNRGEWDITQNPCTEDRARDGIISTRLPTTRLPYISNGAHLNHTIPDIESSRECFCTYDYENYFMKALLRRRILKRGDKVMRGETVSFECRFVRVLSWQNGLRFFGKANMTCSTCEKWQSRDLPTCSYAERRNAVIGSDENLKVLPGGTLEIQEGERSQFFCSNTVLQPQWDYGEKLGVAVNKTEVSENRIITYVSYLEIMKVEKEHSGLYECCLPGRTIPRQCAFLDLMVKGITCPLFTLGNGLSVSYSNSRKIQSLASFSCPVNAKLVGNSRALCKNDGTWTSIQPHCEFEDLKCSIGDLASSISQTVEPDMTAVKSEFVSPGSEMRLKCSDNSILQGNSKVLCGEDGRWKLEGRYECVSGCVLNIDPSSHLLIHPVQDSYRFGEFVLLSCPPGEEMSVIVERLMCLGGYWTDSLPFCKELKKSHQP